jgi:hypothetical protein
VGEPAPLLRGERGRLSLGADPFPTHTERNYTVSDFEFQPEHDGTLSLESAVFQALGAASVCWENMSGTGVFQSERAKAIGDALLAEIGRLAPKGTTRP